MLSLLIIWCHGQVQQRPRARFWQLTVAPCPHLVSTDRLTLTGHWETEPGDYTADLSLGCVHSDFCMGRAIATGPEGEGWSGVRRLSLCKIARWTQRVWEVILRKTEKNSKWGTLEASDWLRGVNSACQVSSSIHQPRLSSLLPPSTPISICNGSQPSFLLLNMLSHTPLYSCGSPSLSAPQLHLSYKYPSVTNMAL